MNSIEPLPIRLACLQLVKRRLRPRSLLKSSVRECPRENASRGSWVVIPDLQCRMPCLGVSGTRYKTVLGFGGPLRLSPPNHTQKCYCPPHSLRSPSRSPKCPRTAASPHTTSTARPTKGVSRFSSLTDRCEVADGCGGRFSPYNPPAGQSSIQREWDSYNPITNPTDASIACNINGASLGSGQLSATVPGAYDEFSLVRKRFMIMRSR